MKSNHTHIKPFIYRFSATFFYRLLHWPTFFHTANRQDAAHFYRWCASSGINSIILRKITFGELKAIRWWCARDARLDRNQWHHYDHEYKHWFRLRNFDKSVMGDETREAQHIFLFEERANPISSNDRLIEWRDISEAKRISFWFISHAGKFIEFETKFSIHFGLNFESKRISTEKEGLKCTFHPRK